MKKIFTLFFAVFIFCSSETQSQISTFPYVATGDNNIGWNVVQGPVLWFVAPATKNPSGASSNPALVCNFYGQPAGVEGLVVSPAFNFTALSKPVLHFYVAYRTYPTLNDSLQVLISTNGGSTFIDTPVPYRRSNNSTPSLATLTPSVSEFNPSLPSQWRHETIDLSAYAGVNNVFIAFRGVSAFGNNLWIDNFIVTNADAYCTSNVGAPGNFSCNPIVNVNMVTTGDPSGGVISVTEHLNQDPVPTLATPNIAVNTTATTMDGSVFTPNIIGPDAWFTVSYTGNDQLGYSTYNISIDISGYISVIDIGKLYIVKRSDLTGSWVALNTTASGSTLTASGLTTFSDFGIGGDSLQNPLPVELSSFTSVINGRSVILKWSTSSEINNSGFDIERSVNNIWNKIGYAAGNGTVNSPNSYSFTDNNLNTGIYNYRLKQVDYNGNFQYYNLVNEIQIGIPEKFELSQNYPNPFNPSTSINYNLPADSRVNIRIFDISGKEVYNLLDEFKTAGYHTVNFNAASFSSGIYFYTINTDNFTATKKMTLLK